MAFILKEIRIADEPMTEAGPERGLPAYEVALGIARQRIPYYIELNEDHYEQAVRVWDAVQMGFPDHAEEFRQAYRSFGLLTAEYGANVIQPIRHYWIHVINPDRAPTYDMTNRPLPHMDPSIASEFLHNHTRIPVSPENLDFWTMSDAHMRGFARSAVKALALFNHGYRYYEQTYRGLPDKLAAQFVDELNLARAIGPDQYRDGLYEAGRFPGAR